MKIRFTLPWGGEFEYEREPRAPMRDGRFYAVCALIAGAMLMAPFVLMVIH